MAKLRFRPFISFGETVPNINVTYLNSKWLFGRCVSSRARSRYVRAETVQTKGTALEVEEYCTPGIPRLLTHAHCSPSDVIFSGECIALWCSAEFYEKMNQILYSAFSLFNNTDKPGYVNYITSFMVPIFFREGMIFNNRKYWWKLIFFGVLRFNIKWWQLMQL